MEFIGVHRIVANDGGVRFPSTSEKDRGLDFNLHLVLISSI